MAGNIKVSVIVPVYNTEKYLAKCLESILAQTLTDIEVICVDDGSEDDSLRILREFKQRDERMRVIHKENGGQVSARKAGVMAASGEYVGFVDSDDWIESDMYEALYGKAEEKRADFVTSDYVQEGNYSSISKDAIEEGFYPEERMPGLRNGVILNLSKHDKGISGSLCTKLFRTELMKRIMPEIPCEIKVAEDKMTTITFLLDCSSAVVLHEAYYHYVMHPESMFHKENPDYLLSMHYVYRYLRTLYGHPNFTENMRKQAELYVVQFLIKGVNSLMGLSFRNLLWIDPYWLDGIPADSRIILYGAGEPGRKYYQQLLTSRKARFVGCVDPGWKEGRDEVLVVHPLEWLDKIAYDFLIITIKNASAAEKVRTQLIKNGVSPEKIKWFPQEEIFWRFAEADGLLKD